MSAMTLDQVRMQIAALGYSADREPWLIAIDAHLAAHAQMVEKVREVIELLLEMSSDDAAAVADMLVAAIGDAK